MNLIRKAIAEKTQRRCIFSLCPPTLLLELMLPQAIFEEESATPGDSFWIDDTPHFTPYSTTPESTNITFYFKFIIQKIIINQNIVYH